MHEVKFTGYDNVENTNNASFKIFTDNKGPELSYSFSTQSLGKNENGLVVLPAHSGIFVSAVDKESGYDRMVYSLNGSKVKEFSGFISSFGKKENQLTITAFDKLGNSSELKIEISIRK
jgi:hypothetical protein